MKTINMNILYKAFPLFTLILLLLGCAKAQDDIPEVIPLGAETITRVVLSPNSPVLTADGKSELSFQVRCYYKVGENEVEEEVEGETDENGEKKTVKKVVDQVEIMLDDRVPYDQIKVKASTGETFNVHDIFTTTSAVDTISFKAILNDVSSNTAKVALIHDSPKVYEQRVIPVRFVTYSSSRSENRKEGITVDLLKEMIDHANKVFSGELMNGPASANAYVTFKYAGLSNQTLELDQNGTEKRINEKDVLKENIFKDAERNLVVVIAPFVPGDMKAAYCKPQYTFGEDSLAVPGLRLDKKGNDLGLIKVDNTSDIQFKPVERLLFMTYNDVYYHNSSYSQDYQFAAKLGFFYGLLRTGQNSSQVTDDLVDNDYCSDTYMYLMRYGGVTKETVLNEVHKEKYFYDSFNPMDENSMTKGFTREQVARMRKVMDDCAFRQQGKK